MSVEVWRFERTTNSHESAALLHLARELEDLPIPYLMIIHPVLGGQEIDALVLKRDMVFVVEIKSAHGPVEGEIYGDWHVTKEDGTTIALNAGREDNPFWQVQKNYFATRDFLTENKTAFMTESEAAVTDFKKIKNVLIFDPEYDEASSNIDLGEDDWKINIVGLHNNVTDPFVTLRHNALNLSRDQAITLAREILHCQFAEDYETLLHNKPPTDPAQANEDPTEEESDYETIPTPPPSNTMDNSTLPIESLGSSFPSSPKFIQRIKDLWRELRDQTGQSKRKIQRKIDQSREQWRATHKVDFERLLHELQKAADGSIHHLTPETFVANYYTLYLDPYSYEHVQQLQDRYQSRAITELRRYISQQGYKLETRYNRMVVQIKEDPELKTQIDVCAEYKEAPTIATIEGSLGEKRALYAGDALRVGREESADYRICKDPKKPVISRRHCLIVVSDDGRRVTVRDEHSTNGTLVNGKRIQFAQLHDGDVILLGRNKRDEEGPTLHIRIHS